MSQVASLAAGVPATQLSTTAPPVHVRMPVRAQPPTPQLVATGTYVIGSQVLTWRNAVALVIEPTLLVTVTVNAAPSSTSAVPVIVYEPPVAPEIATPLRFH